MVRTIIHCYVKGYGHGYAAFLHSTLGLLEYCEIYGLNFEVSYQYHDLSNILKSTEIDRRLPIYQRVIYVINADHQLASILKTYPHEILHVTCLCFEQACIQKTAHRLVLRNKACKLHNHIYDEFRDVCNVHLLKKFRYNILHIRVHDKYAVPGARLPPRKRKYILDSITQCCKISDNFDTILISNSEDVKMLLTKTANVKSIFFDTCHTNMITNNTKHLALVHTMFEFMLVKYARKVVSIPMLYVKSADKLHAGFFAHMAAQIFDVSYIEANARSIFEQYHDVAKESMNSLES